MRSWSRPYIPTGLDDLLPTAKVLVITEGEFKALSAVANGIAATGIAGVTMWAAPGRDLGDRLSGPKSHRTPLTPTRPSASSRTCRPSIPARSTT